MIHPLTEVKFISPEKGYGVVAKQFLPKGTITWVQDKLDMVFNLNKIAELGEEYKDIIDTYTFRDNEGNHILCWDHARYVNHSFNSNCLTTPYNFEIAIRDIQAGEELTDDYGYLNISEPFEAIQEDSDRTVVYPDDLTRYHGVWDEKIADAMQCIFDVDQHLAKFLDEKTHEKIRKITEGQERLDSILNCYYNPVVK